MNHQNTNTFSLSAAVQDFVQEHPTACEVLQSSTFAVQDLINCFNHLINKCDRTVVDVVCLKGVGMQPLSLRFMFVNLHARLKNYVPGTRPDTASLTAYVLLRHVVAFLPENESALLSMFENLNARLMRECRAVDKNSHSDAPSNTPEKNAQTSFANPTEFKVSMDEHLSRLFAKLAKKSYKLGTEILHGGIFGYTRPSDYIQGETCGLEFLVESALYVLDNTGFSLPQILSLDYNLREQGRFEEVIKNHYSYELYGEMMTLYKKLEKDSRGPQ